MKQRTAVVSEWSGLIKPANTELTDSEIFQRYGILFQDAVSAFRHDPNYVVALAEAAARTKRKRTRSVSLAVAS